MSLRLDYCERILLIPVSTLMPVLGSVLEDLVLFFFVSSEATVVSSMLTGLLGGFVDFGRQSTVVLVDEGNGGTGSTEACSEAWSAISGRVLSLSESPTFSVGAGNCLLRLDRRILVRLIGSGSSIGWQNNSAGGGSGSY